MSGRLARGAFLLAGTMLASGGLAPTIASAQSATATDDDGLDVIVVVAQKRDQSLQDVPIAVTAITSEAIEANRIVDVSNLNGLAPGVTVRTLSGGAKLPSFQVRGANSFGLVPGSDKQVSIYIDGVYLASPRGSIFELPDVQQIEVLRGPQGTLFGRNATAGAVSVYTREPDGEFGVTGRLTVGNQKQIGGRISVDLPQMGSFSGYASYVHDERRGDVRNLGAGQAWDRRNAVRGAAKALEISPRWLGNRNAESFFAALKFEPSDAFKTVYKFDYSTSNGTPEATALTGFNRNAPLLGSLIAAVIDNQPALGRPAVPIASDGKRPKAIYNGFSIPTSQKVYGHSLTSTLELGDVTLKNIAAYRFSTIFSAAPIDGFSAVPFPSQAVVPYATFAAFAGGLLNANSPPQQIGATIGALAGVFGQSVGQPFVGIATSTQGRSKQYSDELQLNYDSDALTITAGALWFHGKDYTGEPLLANTVAFAIVPGGVIPATSVGLNFNKQTSIAGYGQVEFHATEQLDFVGGIRLTQDKKSGSFTFGPTRANLRVVNFNYKKTKPSYLVGVNYKPDDDMLLFAKFSTAYVSGGSTAGIPFEPETAESYEVGVKTELLDRKLRLNLAAYHVKYKHQQLPQSAVGSGFPELITQITGDPTLAQSVGPFVFDSGTITAKGVEFEFQAAPTRGVTLGGNLSYYTTKFTDVDPRLKAIYPDPTNPAGDYVPNYRPNWTGAIYGQYDTEPLWGDAYLMFRADANWQSRTNFANNPRLTIYQTYARAIKNEPPFWLVNGRISLRDLEVDGVNTEIALWGTNIFNQSAKTFVLDLANTFATANFIAARAYGLDFTVKF